MTPTPETIEILKAQFPDRVLVAVEAVDGEEAVMSFVMTGPTRDEYDFFVDRMLAAQEAKSEADKVKAVRSAVEKAAIAQIRWPDRQTVQAAFENRPEMIDGFAKEIRKAAGSQIELRSKKL